MALLPNAFTYRGKIQSLNEALDQFGQGLTEGFSAVLGPHAPQFFTTLRNLPTWLENVPTVQLDEAHFSQKYEDVKEGSMEALLIAEHARLVLLCELFAIRMSRDVLDHAGALSAQGRASLDEIVASSEEAAVVRGFTTVPAERFLAVAVDWLRYFVQVKALYNTFQSICSLNVIKQKADPEKVALVLQNGIGFASSYESDNGFGIVDDYTPQDLQLSPDGRIISHKKKIRTFPLFVLNEKALTTDNDGLGSSGAQLTIYPFVHEMCHFAAYAVQRVPMQLAAGILQRAAQASTRR